MKLNPDYIREILLWLEQNQEIDYMGNTTEIYSFELPKKITEFSESDVLYSAKQMIASVLISGRNKYEQKPNITN